MKQMIGLVVLALLSGNVLGQDQPEDEGDKGAPSGRILNGAATSTANYPFALQVYINYTLGCGASIITTTHALSAAQCLESEPNPRIFQIFLYRERSAEYNGSVLFPVSDYIVHPSYAEEARYDFDVAIITARNTFAGLENVAPIALQTTEIAISPNNPSWCYVLGWGQTNMQNTAMASNMKLIWTQLIPQHSCANDFGSQLTSRMLCTKLPNVDICQGDMGGPLVCNGRLTGVVSFGDKLCAGKLPSVYAKVAAPGIRAFISDNTVIVVPPPPVAQ